MTRRSARRFRPSLAVLEARRLLTETAVFFQQDATDVATVDSNLRADGFEDAHIRISNIPINAQITRVEVWPSNGGEYATSGHWAVAVDTDDTQHTVDLYFQPSLSFTANQQYANVDLYYSGATQPVTVYVPVTSNIDPTKRMPGAQVAVTRLGQTGTDIESASTTVGSGNIGSDNKRDYLLHVSNLTLADLPFGNDGSDSPNAYYELVSQATGIRWSTQPNGAAREAGAWSADFVTDSAPGATGGTFYFQPPYSGVDLGNLVFVVHYGDGQTDSSAPFTISYAADYGADSPTPYALSATTTSATWDGAVSSSFETPSGLTVPEGSIHVKLTGLPTTSGNTVSDMVLSDVAGTEWSYSAQGTTVPDNLANWTLSMVFVPSGAGAGDLYFAPTRDETASTLLLRLDFPNGSAVVPVAGGLANPDQYEPVSPPLSPTHVDPATVDDPVTHFADLQDVIDSSSWLELGGGEYDLKEPLVLDHPITITTAPGASAVLTFRQPSSTSSDQPTDFIQIKAGHVHLSGFTVQFTHIIVVHLNNSNPSAAIGIVRTAADPLPDVTINRLDIQVPSLLSANGGQVGDYNGFTCIRTDEASSGSITNNTLIGQGAMINGGPWLVADNDYRGAIAGELINQAFTFHSHVHDVDFKDNKIHQSFPGGETDKALLLSSADYCTIEGNEIDGGLGTHSNSFNTPEIILADNLYPYYIGLPAHVSADGRVVQIGVLRGGLPPGPGMVVSIVSTDYTGAQRWYRVGQVVDSSTLIMADPLPTAGSYYISLNSGYIQDIYRNNRIDISDPSLAQTAHVMQLDGGQFGTTVEDNQFIGGGTPPRFGSNSLQDVSSTIGPASPWGWYPAPAYDFTLAGNTFQDVSGTVQFETDSFTRFPDLFLASGSITNNTFSYSQKPAPAVVVMAGGSYVPGASSVYSVSVSGNDVVGSSRPTITYQNDQGTPDEGFTTPAAAVLAAAPATPGGFGAVASVSRGEIDLTWNAVAGSSGYAIERSPDRLSGWRQIAMTSSAATTYADVGLDDGTQYYYRLKALTVNGYSMFTAVAFATSVAGPPPASFAASSLGQDGRDYVGVGGSTAQNGYQDVDLSLAGLSTQAITYIDVTGPDGHEWQYQPQNAPSVHDSDGAWLVRTTGASTGHLYVEPNKDESGGSFQVSVYYSGNPTAQQASTNAVFATYQLVDPSAASQGQDGADHVGPGGTDAPNGYQDVDVVLTGLAPTKTVNYVDVVGTTNAGGEWQYQYQNGPSPHGSDPAALVRTAGATTAHLYVEPYQNETGRQYAIAVYYSDGTSFLVYTDAVYATYHLADSAGGASPTVTSLGQDGQDHVGLGTTGGADGFQDVDLLVSGLSATQPVAYVDILGVGVGGGEWQYQPSRSSTPHPSDPAALIQAPGATTAHLYIEPIQDESGRQFEITIKYADGSTAVVLTGPVFATNQLPVPTVLSLGQGTADYVGLGSDDSPDGYQDIGFSLAGIAPYKTVSYVDVQVAGSEEWQYNPAAAPTPHSSDPAALVQGADATSVNVFVQPGQSFTTATFVFTVVYGDGSSFQVSADGVDGGFALPTFVATSVGQDGADHVGPGSDDSPDGYQDVDIALAGLNPDRTISYVDVAGTGVAGGEWQYQAQLGPTPHTSDFAVLVRADAATTAHLYVNPQQNETGRTYNVTIYYDDGSSFQADATDIYATFELPDYPGSAAPAATSLGQDGADHVGSGSTTTSNGYQDVDILLTGLEAAKTVSYIDVQGVGSGEWQYQYQSGPSPHGSDPAALVRTAGATTAHLYVEPYQNETGRQYAVTVYYSDGTSFLAYTSGVFATYQLADPSAASQGQDGADYVGSGSTTTSNGYQDVDILLTGLGPAKTVSYIDVQGVGSGEWQYNWRAGPSPHGSDPAALVQAPGSATAHLYVEPYQNETGRQYAIAVYYSDGTSFLVYTDGVHAVAHLPTLAAASQGQDGADYVGPGSTDAPNGYQDVDILLTGLEAAKTVSYVDVQGAGSGEWQYQYQSGPSPHGSDPAALVRTAGATTAHLYVEPYQNETGRTYTITLYYSDGTSFVATTDGVHAVAHLPTLAASSQGQDGADYVGSGSTTTSNGYQDVDILLTGLEAAKTVSYIDVQGAGSGEWQYQYQSGPSPHGSDPAALVRTAGATTAHLYVEPYQNETGRTYTITLYYSDGTSFVATTDGVHAVAHLPTLTAASQGQDGADYVGSGSTTTSNGYQDVDILLTGLEAAKTVSYIDVQGAGSGEWQYQYQSGPNPHGSDPAALVRTAGATTAHLYVEPYQNETGRTYTIRLYYSDGTSFVATTDGVQAAYHLADPSAASEGQDGADYVGSGSTTTSNGFQDVDILLTGLAPAKTVSYVDVQGVGSGEWQYQYQNGPSPHGSDPAALVRTAGATTAHLYVEPYQNETGRQYAVTVYFSDGTSLLAYTNGVFATYRLADPSAASQGQDGADYVGSGSNAAPNGYQDVDILLTGLAPAKTVSYVDVVGTMSDGGEWQYQYQNGPSPHGSDPAALVQAPGSATAHLYVEPYQNETGRTYTITLYYSDGTSFVATTDGVHAVAHLPTLAAASQGQDGADFIGPGSTDAPNGYQDVDILLTGLEAAKTVSYIDVQGAGSGEWQYQYQSGPSPHGSDPAALVRTAGATTAHLYVEPYQNETGRTYTITLYYSDGTSFVATTDGVHAVAHLPTLAAASQGQDGADYVGSGSTTTSNGYQDVDILLTGLEAAKTVSYIDVQGAGSGEWQYQYQSGPSPHGSDPAALVRTAGATTAHLYAEPYQNETGRTYTITLYYSDGTSFVVTTDGVHAVAHLPTLAASSQGQDGADYVGSGSTTTSNGYQDVDILLTGLEAAKTVSYVDVQGAGSGEWQYQYQSGPSPHGSDPAALVRTAGATTAHLYVEPYQNETGRTYTITLYYSDGTSFVATTDGVQAAYHLADPSAASQGQDGADYVGSGSTTTSNGFQDVDILLTGLAPAKTVSYVDVQGVGSGEWQYQYQNGPSPHGSDPAALVRTAGATTAHLYVEPYQNETGRQYAVTVYYSDGTSFVVYTDGIYATSRLPD